jgi:phytoene dehydrogenase-like protein
MRSPRTEVAIIGSGVAGLTAACYLARSGVSVTLFEKASSLGGRATTQEYSGYWFNRGIHALYTGGAASEVLHDLGIAYTGHTPRDIVILRQGRLYKAPYDLRALLRTHLFGVADKLELMRIFAAIPQINARELARTSVQDWLERTIRRPQVRRFLANFASTYVYSAALDVVSAEVLVAKMQLTLKNPVIYVDGGWQSLVEGLRRAAEQAGATLVSGTRVEAVEYEEGQVQGVRLRDGSQIRADAVVIAATPADAVKLVDNGEYPALRRIVEGLLPAQVACLDVALSRLPDSRHAIVQDMEHPRFMSTQSLYSRVAPEGGALIYTFKQLDPRQQSDPHEDRRDLEDLLDTAQPGWREVLVKDRYLPCIEAVGMVPTAQGGGYAGRPGTQVPGITNLYLAGDWIGDWFLSDASFGSARQVAQQVLQQEMRRVPACSGGEVTGERRTLCSPRQFVLPSQ